MPDIKKFDRTMLFNLLKLVWWVAIFYFWLKLCVPSTVKEDFVSENMYEWQEYSTADELDDDFKTEIWKHDAPFLDEDVVIDDESMEEEYRIRYEDICQTNQVFCDKITFNGSYTYKDKYMYLASSIYILRFIENNIQIGLPIKNQLSNIVINPAINARRWFANWTTVTLNLWSVSSYVEFMELMSHELGHVVDLWVVKWYSMQKDLLYTEFGNAVFMQDDPSISYYQLSWQNETIRKDTAIVSDFCSSYAMSDPFEDFAECHNLYLNHNAIFKAWAQNNDVMRQKYNFFANLYWWRYLFNTSSDLKKYSATATTRPWDTTKM